MALQNTLKALADPIRREILNLLKGGRMSAGDITDRFDVTGASISRHLSVLKEADLIRDTREGKFIYYELNASVLEEIMLWITTLKGETDNERKKISGACRQEAEKRRLLHRIRPLGPAVPLPASVFDTDHPAHHLCHRSFLHGL